MAWNEATNDAIANAQLDDLGVDDIEAIDPKGLRNYLHVAAAEGQIESVLWLLARGATADGTTGGPYTPLHLAAEMGYTKICELLLDAGANPEALEEGQSGGTPLVLALFYGHAATADLLAQHVIAPRNLRTAAGLGRVDLLEELYGTPAASAAREWYRPHDGYPKWAPSDHPAEVRDEALVYAAGTGRVDAVRWLLAQGAKADAVPYCCNAVHAAIYHHHDDVLEELLETQPDLTIEDPIYKGTPADWARHNNRDDLAVRLES